MSSYDEIIAAARANIAGFDRARDGVEAAKSKADEAQQQAMSLGSQSRAAGAEHLKQLSQEAQGLVQPIRAKLQEIIDQITALKTFSPGQGGGAASTAATPAADGAGSMPLPEPDGERLVRDSEESAGEKKKRRSRLLNQAMKKSDDIEDAARTVGDNLRISFPEPPPKETQAGAAVPTGQQSTPQFQNNDAGVDAGMGFASMLVTAIAVTHVGGTVKNAFGNMVDKRRRRREQD